MFSQRRVILSHFGLEFVLYFFRSGETFLQGSNLPVELLVLRSRCLEVGFESSDLGIRGLYQLCVVPLLCLELL